MKQRWKNFLGGYLNTCAMYNADGDFMVFGDRRITWGELNDRVNRLATALVDLGVKKNDKVTFMFRNCPEFFEVNYAIQKAGGIPVPMNYRFTPREIEFQANHSDAVIFLVEDQWLEAVQGARPNLPNILHFICTGKNCPDDMIPYEDLMSKYPPHDPEVEVNPEDVCVIIYTGGTTGRPKGVMLTYMAHVKMLQFVGRTMMLGVASMDLSGNMIERIISTMPALKIVRALKLLKGPVGQSILNSSFTRKAFERFITTTTGNPLMIRFGPKGTVKAMVPSLPLFHDASYHLVINGPLTCQFTFIQPDVLHFDPVEVFKMIEREKVNLMANVPTAWKMLVEDPRIGDYKVNSVVICTTGGGVSPAGLKKQILEKFPSSMIMDNFGQTEMTPTTSIRLDVDVSKLKDRSVGKPIVEAKIVDENDRDVPQGQTGEIIYKSETVMKGYYKVDSGQTFKNGWFYSGDLGYFDEEGEIRVVERKKECISSGGEKIFPLEVEELLDDHPAIEKTCVIGVPDEKWGSIVRAVVVLKSGQKLSEEEIIEWTRGKIAGYKKPRSVIFTEALPISVVGKLQRGEVRKKFGSA